jgi:hypothetical protein
MQIPNILIATHHKSGTTWMGRIFRAVARVIDSNFVVHTEITKREVQGLLFPSVCLVTHSRINWQLLGAPWRGLHVIRDPRDMLISAARYHRDSRESWLHNGKTQYDGLTYQQKINELATEEERLLFELRNASSWTFKDMEQWDYKNARVFEAKYEQLIADKDMMLFHQILTFLGIPGKHIPKCLQAVWRTSLFGEFDRSEDAEHIRSGEPHQWQSAMPATISTELERMFPSLLRITGYRE